MATREMGKEGLDVVTEVRNDHPQRMEMWKCLKPLVSGLLNSYPYFFFRGSFPPKIQRACFCQKILHISSLVFIVSDCPMFKCTVSDSWLPSFKDGDYLI